MSSSVRKWVIEIPWMQQGVLFSMLRNMDGARRSDPSRIVVKGLRGMILKPARSVGSFLGETPTDEELVKAMESFLKECNHLPIHFVLHLIHAAEVVGYKYPGSEQLTWLGFYSEMCKAMHMNPETQDQMEERLKDDPLVKRTSEELDGEDHMWS